LTTTKQHQGEQQTMKKHPLIGNKVIVRDNRAGVFFGTLVEYDGKSKTAALKDARKIWYWKGALAVEDIAATGLDVNQSKITAQVEHVDLCDVVQVVLCSASTSQAIKGAHQWKP
jgi:hypothetical protein